MVLISPGKVCVDGSDDIRFSFGSVVRAALDIFKTQSGPLVDPGKYIGHNAGWFLRNGVEVLDGRMTGQEGDLQRPS